MKNNISWAPLIIRPITRAGDTGWVLSVPKAKQTGMIGTMLNPPIKQKSRANHKFPVGNKYTADRIEIVLEIVTTLSANKYLLVLSR